jgi:hypothetical protein
LPSKHEALSSNPSIGKKKKGCSIMKGLINLGNTLEEGWDREGPSRVGMAWRWDLKPRSY